VRLIVPVRIVGAALAVLVVAYFSAMPASAGACKHSWANAHCTSAKKAHGKRHAKAHHHRHAEWRHGKPGELAQQLAREGRFGHAYGMIVPSSRIYHKACKTPGRSHRYSNSSRYSGYHGAGGLGRQLEREGRFGHAI
jgi:hypothetical protein